MHDALERLSPRERDVLQLVALGLGNKQIAAALELRQPTVKGYLQSIYAKTGVQNRAQAAALWAGYAGGRLGEGHGTGPNGPIRK